MECPAVGEDVTYRLHEVTSNIAVAGITLERVSNLARFFQDSHMQPVPRASLRMNKEREMANIKYFSDVTDEAVALAAPHGMPNKEFAARWPGVQGIRYDGYQMLVGHEGGNLGGAVLPVTRKIEYKSQPSRHECNAKCLNGKHNGTCECKCGGKNHGAGMFTSLLKAA